MKNPFKDFFYFSRRERCGILLLISGIFLIILIGYGYSFYREKLSEIQQNETGQAATIAEYKLFSANIHQKERQRRKRYASFTQKEKQPPILTPFDPNTADSITLLQLGLPQWMTRNILKYRIKEGRFHKAEDFKKVYGLSQKQYQQLLPYIQIASIKDTSRTSLQLYKNYNRNDSVPKVRAYKYPKGTIINLNLADTTELKKIPGVGSGIARLIVGYRHRLGGFYSVEQLQEIHLDYQKLEPWFSLNCKDIHLINLNHSSVERLYHHPYINFYQAKAMVEYRKKKGTLHNLKVFRLYEEFSETDLKRISHYICFE